MFVPQSFPSCTIWLRRKPSISVFDLDPDGQVIGHLECEFFPAVLFVWKEFIDMGVVDKEVECTAAIGEVFRNGGEM